MSETGVLLRDYILPIAVLADLVLIVIGDVLIVASMIAEARSSNRRCKNRAEELSWRLKALGYIKLWTLLFAVSSVFGVIISFIVGQKGLLYGNFLVGILFCVFFLATKQSRKLVSKELDSVKAILTN